MKEFLLVASIHLLAVMSPGPDFAMVIRNSLIYSRRTGVLAAVGLGLGILLHVTYSLLGIGLVISQSVLLFNAIKLIGAGYLIFIGLKSLFAKKETKAEISRELHDEFKDKKLKKDLSTIQAIRMGFLTNALNPKATLFFVALFTQIINHNTALGIKVLYGAEMSVATFVWFAVVASALTHRRINKLFLGVRTHLERVFGVILVGLGISVALDLRK